jgi:hypothetical protein
LKREQRSNKRIVRHLSPPVNAECRSAAALPLIRAWQPGCPLRLLLGARTGAQVRPAPTTLALRSPCPQRCRPTAESAAAGTTRALPRYHEPQSKTPLLRPSRRGCSPGLAPREGSGSAPRQADPRAQSSGLPREGDASRESVMAARLHRAKPTYPHGACLLARRSLGGFLRFPGSLLVGSRLAFSPTRRNEDRKLFASGEKPLNGRMTFPPSPRSTPRGVGMSDGRLSVPPKEKGECYLRGRW